MRDAADAERIERLACELGRVVPPGTRMYLTGGATAVLEGWREWEDRSRFRLREGNLEVFDFDPYSQALSKLERGFDLDLADVRNMVDSGQVEPARLGELFEAIEPELYRFPAIELATLRAAVESLRSR